MLKHDKYIELFHTAIQKFNLGKYKDSEKICNKLIELNFKHSDLYNLLAMIKSKNGDLINAIRNMTYAINIQPNNQIYLNNIADFYRKKGDFNKAIEYLKKSLNINSQFHSSLYLLGSVYKEMGNNVEAEKVFLEAIRIFPDDYKSINNLGLISVDKKDYKQAKDYFRRAIFICPEDLDLKLNIIFIYSVEKDNYHVEYYCRKILEIDPHNIKALSELSILLYLEARIDEFKQVYEFYISTCYTDFDDINRSREICLDLVASVFNTSNFEIDKYREYFMSEISSYKPFKNKEFIKILDMENLFLDLQFAYHGRDNKKIKIKYYDLFKGYFDNKPLKFNNGKIKIGFLVTKGHENIFRKFMSNLINSLPVSEFEIYLISNEIGWKTFIKEYINEDVKKIFIKETINEAANEILKFNLDILYHWEVGTSRENYFLPFYRLAPAQCTSIGWPDTTGMDTVDYFISSELIETENAQENYTEKLIKFKKLPFNINSHKVDKDNLKDLDYFGLDKNNNIYLCCQNLRKIHPDFDILVAGILNKDPNGIVVFVKSGIENISELLKLRIRIKSPEIYSRVIFLDEMKYNDYLSILTHAKVILDTLYFGGGNTSYEAFAMNTPVVTMPWTHERGRYTLGCYKQMGIEGLVASSFEEYIDLALKIGNDKEFRDQLVKDISKNNHKLFNDKEVIQEYIDFFKLISRNLLI